MSKLTEATRSPVLSVIFGRELYASVYLAVCALMSLPVFAGLLSLPAKACFVWGMLVILWDLVSRRRFLRAPFWALPAALLVSYAVTVVLNRDVLTTGAKHFGHLAISLLVMYAADRDAPTDKLLRWARVNFWIINVVSFFSGLASLVLFARQASFTIEGPQATYRQGFLENRLFGVYTSPNTGALLAVTAIAGAVFIILTRKKKKIFELPFLIANIVVQAVYFSLTLSKGGMLAYAFFIAFIFVFIVFRRMRASRGAFASAALTAVLCAVCLAASFGVMKGTQKVMSYVPALVSSGNSETPPEETTAAPDDATTEPAPTEPAPDTEPGGDSSDISFDRIEDGSDLSNNRFKIWRGAVKVLLAEDPLFGVADMDVTRDTARQRFDVSSLSEEEFSWIVFPAGYLHNVYVQVLAYAGIVGLAIFLAFAALLVAKLFSTLFKIKPDGPVFGGIAALTALCGAYAANGVAEAHLLFHRQDPFGILFWFCIGTAAVLADRARRDADCLTGDTENVAIIASTPLQTLNAVAFVEADIEGSRGSADLYVAHPFANSEKLAAALRDSGVFNNVYELDAFGKYSPLKSKLSTFFRIFFPETALKKLCRQKTGQKGYRVVAATSQTSASVALHLAYPEAKVVMYDDGVGSYYGNMVRDYNSGLFNAINALFFLGRMNLDPQRLYVLNPGMCEATISAEIMPLPPLGGDALAAAERIFDYRENSFYEGKAVYLSQPLGERAGYIPENDGRIVGLIEEILADRAVVRVHPRQSGMTFGNLPADPFGNQWELECMRSVTDDSVLIGGFSTAQIMPKLLCGKEPRVVFTYRLLMRDCSDEGSREILKLIDNFTRSYSDPSRVAVPETMEELEAILRGLRG